MLSYLQKKGLLWNKKKVTTFRNSVEEQNCCTKKKTNQPPRICMLHIVLAGFSYTLCSQITVLAEQSCIPWEKTCWLVWERMHWAIKFAVLQADVFHSHYGWLFGEQYYKMFWCWGLFICFTWIGWVKTSAKTLTNARAL